MIRALLVKAKSMLTGEPPRSPKWPAVEKAFLEEHPRCEACGEKNSLNVHHVRPYHKEPALELEPANLITLCRSHHLTFGHLMNWKSWNIHVRDDVATYFAKVKRRP